MEWAISYILINFCIKNRCIILYLQYKRNYDGIILLCVHSWWEKRVKVSWTFSNCIYSFKFKSSSKLDWVELVYYCLTEQHIFFYTYYWLNLIYLLGLPVCFKNRWSRCQVFRKVKWLSSLIVLAFCRLSRVFFCVLNIFKKLHTRGHT